MSDDGNRHDHPPTAGVDTKTLMRERITENTRVQFPVGTKVWRGHLVYVASGITSRRTKQLYSTLAKGGRPAFLPGTGPLRGL